MNRNKKAQHHKRLGAAILGHHAWSEIAKALGITARETQIIQAVFDNLTEKEIAERLKISPHTVHMHMNRLFNKLTVRSRTELVLRIVEELVTLTLSETAVLPPLCPRHHRGACRMRRPPVRPRKA